MQSQKEMADEIISLRDSFCSKPTIRNKTQTKLIGLPQKYTDWLK